MRMIKCPSCQVDKAFDAKKKKCTREECQLFHASCAIENNKKRFFSWKSLFWKIYYWRPRDGYYYIKNRFFRRWDLVKTPFDKHGWMDVDALMLYAVMGLVERYVVDELGIYFVEEDDSNEAFLIEHAKRQNKTQRKILELYIDWKVTYPYMQTKLTDILMDDDTSSEAYFAFEEQVEKYEDQLMRRAINLRRSMWT